MAIQFTPHAIAFVDILGFKSFVKKAEAPDTGETLEKLRKLFEEVIPKTSVFDGFSSYVPVHCLSVSDSIVIASSHQDNDGNFDGYSSVVAVSIKCIQIAHALLDLGLLVKGAITVGPVYMIHESAQNGRMSNILGSGYMDAYKLEQETKEPIIRLDKTATDIIKNNDFTKLSIFANSPEGMIVDAILPGRQFLLDPSEQIPERFERYGKTIEEKLNEHENWVMVAYFFNVHIKDCSELREVQKVNLRNYEGYKLNCLNPPEESTAWMDEHSSGAKFVGRFIHD